MHHHADLGRALADGGLGAEGVSFLEDAADLRPDSFGYVRDLGLLLFELGRYAEARPVLERALALLPGLGPEAAAVEQELREQVEGALARIAESGEAVGPPSPPR